MRLLIILVFTAVLTNIALADVIKYDTAAIFKEAFGKQAKRKRLPQLDVKIIVDEDEQGEAKLFTNQMDDSVRIEAGPVLRSLADYLYPEQLRAIKRLVTKGMLTPEALGKLKITSQYNDERLSFDIDIPRSIRKPSQLNKIKKPLILDSELQQPASVSGFANIYTNYSYSTNRFNDNKSSNNSLSLQLEAVLNFSGLTVENKFSYSESSSSDDWKHNHSRLIWDDPERLMRFKVGNINTLSEGYQISPSMTGLSVSKEFNLDPYSNYYSRGEQSFTLDAKSEVEIFSNSTSKRKLTLKAGEYTFNQLGLQEGANEIQLVITNEFGVKKVLNYSVFHSSQLLKAGVSRYALNIGVPSFLQGSDWENHKSNPLISGFYQKGVTQSLTVGANAQINKRGVVLGIEATKPTAWGKVTGDFAASTDKLRGEGFAARLNYAPPLNKKTKHPLRWNLSFDFSSSEFSSLVTTPESRSNTQDYTNSSLAGINFFASKRLGKRTSTSFSTSYRKKRNSESDALSASLSLSRSLQGGASVSGSLRHYDGDEKDTSIHASFSLPLDKKSSRRRKTLRGTYNGDTNAKQLELNIGSLGYLGVDSLSGNLSIEEGGDDRVINGNVNFTHDRFNLYGSHSSRQSKADSSSRSDNSFLSLNTAFSFADGAWGVSKPIRNSFAIFSTNRPLKSHEPIAVTYSGGANLNDKGGNQLLPDYYRSVINHLGSGVVNDLAAYRYSKLDVDTRNLPMNSVVRNTSVAFKPGYRQGYNVSVGGELGVIADGYLFGPKGKSLGFSAGEVTSLSKKQFPKESFFTNSEGRFRLPVLPKGRYRMTLFDYPNKLVDFNIPDDSKQTTFDLGKLRFK